MQTISEDKYPCSLSDSAWNSVNFEGKKFSDRFIDKAAFNNCFFRGSFFNGNNFNNCIFINVDFTLGNFKGSEFTKCKFDGCIFKETNLVGAKFTECNLEFSQFLNSQLENCKITSTLFYICNFNRNNFCESILKLCELNCCEFTSNKCLKSLLDQTKLISIQRWESNDFTDSEFNSVFSSPSYAEVFMKNDIWVRTKLCHCKFSNMTFDKIDLFGSIIRESCFQSCVINPSMFYTQVKFMNSSLLGCTLKEIDMSGSRFYICEISDCDLRGSNFSNALFEVCILKNNNLLNSNMNGVDFTKSDWSQCHGLVELAHKIDFSDEESN